MKTRVHAFVASQGRRSNNTWHSANVSSVWFTVRFRLSHISDIRIAWHLANMNLCTPVDRRTDTLPAVSIVVLSRFCEWWALDHSTSAPMLAKTPGQNRWTWEPGLRHDGGTRAGTFIVTWAGTQTQADKLVERHMPRTLRARSWPCSRHAFSLARVWQDQARRAHALAMQVP
jgi:hypothetical protein